MYACPSSIVIRCHRLSLSRPIGERMLLLNSSKVTVSLLKFAAVDQSCEVQPFHDRVDTDDEVVVIHSGV